MAGVIDADSHVAESESMWRLLDEGMYHRRPVIISVPDDTLYGDRNAFWLIDGNIFPKPVGKGGFLLITPSAAKRESKRADIQIACREITDPEARLADMDKMGVQTQVIYPTLFLVFLTADVELEIALCQAYNRWMAQAWSRSNNRMRWVTVLPLRSIEDSLKEMRKAKENGAVGIFFRGLEGDRTLDDPYFFPIYEEASGLNLPICIHTGPGSPTLLNMFDPVRNHTFPQNRVLPLMAFRDIVANDIPELFPKLRFGFVEAAAGWVPYMVHILKRLLVLRGRWKHNSPVELFEKYRLYVACEADEDIPYLLQYTGEDHLITGSDYGHIDPSTEAEFVETLKGRGDIPPRALERMLDENPRRFYGL